MLVWIDVVCIRMWMCTWMFKWRVCLHAQVWYLPSQVVSTCYLSLRPAVKLSSHRNARPIPIAGSKPIQWHTGSLVPPNVTPSLATAVWGLHPEFGWSTFYNHSASSAPLAHSRGLPIGAVQFDVAPKWIAGCYRIGQSLAYQSSSPVVTATSSDPESPQGRMPYCKCGENGRGES